MACISIYFCIVRHSESNCPNPSYKNLPFAYICIQKNILWMDLVVLPNPECHWKAENIPYKPIKVDRREIINVIDNGKCLH